MVPASPSTRPWWMRRSLSGGVSSRFSSTGSATSTRRRTSSRAVCSMPCGGPTRCGTRSVEDAGPGESRGVLADDHRAGRGVRDPRRLARRRPSARLRDRAHGDRDGHHMSARARPRRPAGRRGVHVALRQERAAHPEPHGLRAREEPRRGHLRKTGTLTEGRFGVTDLVALADVDEDEVLRLAASLESQSDHPIAAGIVAAAKDRGIDLSPRRSSGRFRARARRRAWTARTSRS